MISDSGMYCCILGYEGLYCYKSPCTHLCIVGGIGPAYFPSCACPSHRTLLNDSFTCSEEALEREKEILSNARPSTVEEVGSKDNKRDGRRWNYFKIFQ